MVLKWWVKKMKAGRWKRTEIQMWDYADVGPNGDQRA